MRTYKYEVNWVKVKAVMPRSNRNKIPADKR